MPNDDIIIITPPVKPQFVVVPGIKRWWQSRTVWWGMALASLGAVVQYLDTAGSLLAPYLGQWAGLVAIVIGVVNVLLRLRTATAIGKPQL